MYIFQNFWVVLEFMLLICIIAGLVRHPSPLLYLSPISDVLRGCLQTHCAIVSTLFLFSFCVLFYLYIFFILFLSHKYISLQFIIYKWFYRNTSATLSLTSPMPTGKGLAASKSVCRAADVSLFFLFCLFFNHSSLQSLTSPITLIPK